MKVRIFGGHEWTAVITPHDLLEEALQRGIGQCRQVRYEDVRLSILSLVDEITKEHPM